MKVEKINENKVKITLTIDELKQRKINIKDIEKDATLARNLFIDLIEETKLDEDFVLDDSQLYIEASSDNNNLFIVTITKIDHMPDISKYSLKSKSSKTKIKTKALNNTIKTKVKVSRKVNTKLSKKKKNNIDYRVDSTLYAFNSMKTLLDACAIFKKENLYFGKNSLYRYQNKYFILFEKSTINNKKFIKTFSVISEFCEKYYSEDLFDISVKENSKLIIKDNALQKLNKF